MTAYRRAKYPPSGRAESEYRGRLHHDRLMSKYQRVPICETDVNGWGWRIEHLPDVDGLQRVQLLFRKPDETDWAFRRGMNIPPGWTVEKAADRMLDIMDEQGDIAWAIENHG